MRFSLEPLPRSGSPRNIAVVVAMLVGGIALSVHEYLQSESTPPRRRVHAAYSETADVCPRKVPSAGTCPAPAPMPVRPPVARDSASTSSSTLPSVDATAASPAPTSYEPGSG